MKTTKALSWILPIFIAMVGSCSEEDKDNGALCDKLTAEGIQMSCSGVMTSQISNIQYDGYGRVVSLHFHFSCSSSDEEYTGDLTNMTYNSYGQLLSYDATINGTQCHFSVN